MSFFEINEENKNTFLFNDLPYLIMSIFEYLLGPESYDKFIELWEYFITFPTVSAGITKKDIPCYKRVSIYIISVYDTFFQCMIHFQIVGNYLQFEKSNIQVVEVINNIEKMSST